MYQHDGDEDSGMSHDDDSQQLARHLANFDQGCSFNVLFPVPDALPAVRIAFAIRPVSVDHTTVPLARWPDIRAFVKKFTTYMVSTLSKS